MTSHKLLCGKQINSVSYLSFSSDQSNMTTVTSWKTGSDLLLSGGFLRYGMQYQNGRLVVPVSGMYFIHSYIELYELCGDVNNTEEEKQEIKHAVYKFSIMDDKETEIVAKTYSHKTSSNKEFVYYTSYVSIIDHLNAGNEVSVKVSDMSLLKYPDENFFGVTLL